MAARTAGRKGRPWRLLCAQVYATETHCIRCGQWVDLALPYRDPDTGRVNRLAKSVDHITALAEGGPPLARTNVGLAHLGCNSTAGAHLRWARAHRRATPRRAGTPARAPERADPMHIDPASL